MNKRLYVDGMDAIVSLGNMSAVFCEIRGAGHRCGDITLNGVPRVGDTIHVIEKADEIGRHFRVIEVTWVVDKDLEQHDPCGLPDHPIVMVEAI